MFIPMSPVVATLSLLALYRQVLGILLSVMSCHIVEALRYSNTSDVKKNMIK